MTKLYILIEFAVVFLLFKLCYQFIVINFQQQLSLFYRTSFLKKIFEILPEASARNSSDSFARMEPVNTRRLSSLEGTNTTALTGSGEEDELPEVAAACGFLFRLPNKFSLGSAIKKTTAAKMPIVISVFFMLVVQECRILPPSHCW